MRNAPMKLVFSAQEFFALCHIVNELEATLGTGQDDTKRERWVKHMDKMLAKNKLKR